MSINNEKYRTVKKISYFRYILFILLIIILCLFSGCIYSFKGGSVPAHLKTIAIPILEDQSGYGDPTLRDSFTQQLDSIFRSDNTLQLTDRNSADSMLEGVITSVVDEPSVLEGGEQVAERRITVTTRFVFHDLKLQKKIWEKTFSKWGNYPSGGSGLTRRNEGVQDAIKKLIEEILNDTVAGW
jgi:hypothetical protein